MFCRFGTVRSKNCTKRVLKFKILPPPPAPTVKGKSSLFIPKTELKTNGNVTETTNTNTDSKVGMSKYIYVNNLIKNHILGWFCLKNGNYFKPLQQGC